MSKIVYVIAKYSAYINRADFLFIRFDEVSHTHGSSRRFVENINDYPEEYKSWNHPVLFSTYENVRKYANRYIDHLNLKIEKYGTYKMTPDIFNRKFRIAKCEISNDDIIILKEFSIF